MFTLKIKLIFLNTNALSEDVFVCAHDISSARAITVAICVKKLP
jgi:hypothetical protein